MNGGGGGMRVEGHPAVKSASISLLEPVEVRLTETSFKEFIATMLCEELEKKTMED